MTENKLSRNPVTIHTSCRKTGVTPIDQQVILDAQRLLGDYGHMLEDERLNEVTLTIHRLATLLKEMRKQDDTTRTV